MTKTEFIRRVRAMEKPVLKVKTGFFMFPRTLWIQVREIYVNDQENNFCTESVLGTTRDTSVEQYENRCHKFVKKYNRWFKEATHEN